MADLFDDFLSEYVRPEDFSSLIFPDNTKQPKMGRRPTCMPAVLPSCMPAQAWPKAHFCHFKAKHQAFVSLLSNLYSKFMEIISLRTPGNYSASFRSNIFSILWGRPKPDMSMISGCLDPWEPLFMDLNIPNYSN